MQTLKQSERIRMFVHEYYFGLSIWMTINRIAGGPLMIVLGSYLIQNDPNKFGIAYGGFCLAYGIYFTFKPLLWIAFRLQSFRTVTFSIEITPQKLKVKDSISETEILFDGLRKIARRPYFFVIELPSIQKIYLPFSLITEDDITILNSKINTPKRFWE